MKRVLRWTGYALGFLCSLLILMVLGIYGVSEYRMTRTFEVSSPLIAPAALPKDPAVLAEGERLARTRGCIGCHGNLDGAVFLDAPFLARLTAPNLRESMEKYSLGELDAIIRHGIYPDGRGTMAMPSSMLHFLSDEDLIAILAFIQSVEHQGQALPPSRYRIGARTLFALGHFQPQPRMIRELPPMRTSQSENPSLSGEYLVRTTCTECHGDHLGGDELGSPSLVVAKAYSPEAFRHLMKEGVAIGDRELGLMASVSRNRFSHFTDEEIEAMHNYLRQTVIPLATD